MRKRINDYILILITTIILLFCVLYAYKITRNINDFVNVSIDVTDHTLIINSFYEKNDNIYYFFLPSHYKENKTKVNLESDMSLINENIVIFETIDISEIETNHIYKLYRKGKEYGQVMFLASDNIPAIYIDTSSGNIESYLENDKHSTDKGKILIVNETGDITYGNNLVSISGRGNTSWESCKKSWAISLSEEANLLGMKKSANWILLSNTEDNSFGLRNYIAYNFAKNIGLSSTSELRFVDLYVDRDYKGTYQLVERIEENDEKLNIGNLDDLNNSANHIQLDVNKIQQIREYDSNEGIITKSWSVINSPSIISGGYIIERNYGYKLQDKPHVFSTNYNEHFVIRYPTVVSKEENEYISNIVQHVENALFSDDYIDYETNKNLLNLIDIDSFVLKYLVDEVTKNEGAGSTSCYYYKKQDDDLLYAGPIWDYDKSLGQFEDFKNPEGLTYSAEHPASPTLWYKEMYDNPVFNLLVKEYYVSRCRPYMIEIVNNNLDEYIDVIEESNYMNWARWKSLKIPEIVDEYNDSDLEIYYCENLSENSVYLKQWILKRIEYLDSVWMTE